MPAIGRSARFLTILTLLVLVPAVSLAVTKKHSFEIGILQTFSRFDTQYDVSNEWYQTIEVGFNFTHKHGLEVSFASFTANPDVGVGFPITVNNGRVGYVFNKTSREKFVSLLRFGVGRQSIDPAPHVGGSQSIEDLDRNFMWYGGGGFRYFFNDWIGLRFDGTLDFVYTKAGLEAADIQGTGNVGLIFSIGGKDPQ